MEKVITTMLLLIAAIVATVVVVNSVLPSIQRTSSDIVTASDVVGTRLRTDVKIVETSGVDTDDFAQVWAKNVGASTIPSLDKIDVFFGETNDFARIPYEEGATCSDPGQRTQDCWQYTLENDTKWAPFATLRITVYLDTYTLAAGTEYVATIVVSNGITASKVFTV